MQEIFILSMLVGGLAALMQQQGGLAFVSKQIEKLITRFQRHKVKHHAAPQNWVWLA